MPLWLREHGFRLRQHYQHLFISVGVHLVPRLVHPSLVHPHLVDDLLCRTDLDPLVADAQRVASLRRRHRLHLLHAGRHAQLLQLGLLLVAVRRRVRPWVRR